MADLTYTQNSIWTKFIATSKEGESVWREIEKQSGNGVAAVLNIHAKQVIKQIRDAGYTVTKSKPVTKKELNKIFDELDELLA